MTRDDFIGRLEQYLDDYEGYTPMPEGVRQAVRASLPTVKQGGPLRGPERLISMTAHIPAPARYGLAAAAVLAAAVLGASLFGGGGGVGGPGNSPAQTSPSPSAEPTPVPTAAQPWSLLDSPESGDLPPGEHYLDLEAYPARIEFDVPPGWWHFWASESREGSDVHAVLVNSLDTGAANGSAYGVSFAVVGEINIDPCDRAAGVMDPSVTESADSLAAAFNSWSILPASVEDVEIGGYDGKRVELDTREVPCLATLFTTPAGFAFQIQRGREEAPAPPEQFTFLDVDGEVLTIWTTDYTQTNYFELDGGALFDLDVHAQDQAELRAILDSIVIEPRP